MMNFGYEFNLRLFLLIDCLVYIVILELDICCDLFWMDTIDDLILISFKSEEEHALDFV